MRSVQIDIGGTWTRIRTPNGVEKVPSPSALHRQNASHDQLVRELIHLLANHAPRNSIAYVSLGAAYDQETDIAYGSAPLWGPARWDVPMRRLLEAVRPDVYWSIVNDVSAGLAHFIDKYARPADRYVTYLTISSGIALRTAHVPTRCIAVNAEGLQGEVGHLPAASSAPEAVRSLKCDCGRRGHIAAISSGPAIPRVASALGLIKDIQQSAEFCYLRGHDKERMLLRTIVEPVAQIVRFVCTLQPHTDLIGIGGGVPTGIGKIYKEELIRQLSVEDSYVDNARAMKTKILIVSDREVSPEIGAQILGVGEYRIQK